MMGEKDGDDDEGEDGIDESTVKPSRSFRSASLLEEASRSHYGTILDVLLALLEPPWGPLGILLGGLGSLLGPSRAQWLKHDSFYLASPLGGRKTAAWDTLGALLERSSALLGPSWARLGALLGHPGATLRLQKTIGSEKRRMQTH